MYNWEFDGAAAPKRVTPKKKVVKKKAMKE